LPTINATVGAADANSYITLDEADAYFESRLPLTPPWNPAAGADGSNSAAIIMATRLIDSMFAGKTYIKEVGGKFWRVRSRYWNGVVATSVQALAWPREGMLDPHGRLIASNALPKQLKEATAELAGQLLMGDTTLDNSVIVQGITSVRAGSVAVTFKDMIEKHVIPGAVLNLLPEAWFVEETITGARAGSLELV